MGERKMDFVLLGVIIAVVVILWLILVDSNRFVVVRYHIDSPKIHKAYRCVVLADLHNKQFGQDNQVLLEAIRAEAPDGIFVVGDMVTAKLGEGYAPAKAFLEALAESYPVYYANGNHEQRLKRRIRGKHECGEQHKHHEQQKHQDQQKRQIDSINETFIMDYQRPLEEAGISFLENRQVSLGDTGIVLYGLDMDHNFYQKRYQSMMDKPYMTGILGQPEQDAYVVLLAHNPEFFPTYEEWGADLVLSGHIHGGMVRVPFWGKGMISPSLELFPKYDGGSFIQGNATMLLSRGIGMHTVPIRLFNPGEILVVDFRQS
jgi:predicted MPP superfamily phosphohydrolase